MGGEISPPKFGGVWVFRGGLETRILWTKDFVDVPISLDIRGFEKGLAGGGWRPGVPKIQQKCPPELRPATSSGGIGKWAEKRPEFRAWEGFPCANPLCPPTPFRNF